MRFFGYPFTAFRASAQDTISSPFEGGFRGM